MKDQGWNTSGQPTREEWRICLHLHETKHNTYILWKVGSKTMLRTRTSMRVACKEGEGENPELWRHVENRKRSDKGHRVKNVDHAGQHFPRRGKV